MELSINQHNKIMTKKAIVMGATSGIGMEVAKRLASKGWQVGIAGRRTERLQALMTDGITCYQQIDVTSADAPTQLQQLIDKLGGMDLYFHSSGIGWQNNLLDIEKELKTVETNGMGFTRMVDTAFNWFAAHTPTTKNKHTYRIACITSIAECLAQQARMRHLPISITDIRPGFVETALIAGSSYPLQLKPEVVAQHIVHAIERKKEIKVIDWRYAILVFFWRLIPRWLWTRLQITK